MIFTKIFLFLAKPTFTCSSRQRLRPTLVTNGSSGALPHMQSNMYTIYDSGGNCDKWLSAVLYDQIRLINIRWSTHGNFLKKHASSNFRLLVAIDLSCISLAIILRFQIFLKWGTLFWGIIALQCSIILLIKYSLTTADT